MAITPVTVTFKLVDFLGFVPDVRRTKVLLDTNVDSGFLVDTTTGGSFRIADANVTIDSTGLASFTVLPSGATGLNPSAYQIRVRIDAANPVTRKRETVDLGWYTITAAADLKDLVSAQYVPPTYLSTVTTTLDAKVAAAEAARDEAVDISNISTSDGVVTAIDNNAASAFRVQQDARLSATYASKAGTAATLANAQARTIGRSVVTHTTGDYTINSATLIAVANTGAADALDVRVAAKVGDTLALNISAVFDNGPVIRFTAFTMVSGSAVSNVSDDQGASSGVIPGWSRPGGVYEYLTGTHFYTVRPADIDANGYVTLRPYVRTQGGARIIGGSATDPLTFGAVNLGGGHTWLMTTFSYDNMPAHEAEMYVMGSEDLINWRVLNDTAPVHLSATGLLHDPAVLKHTDGYYYVAYSSSYASDNVRIARSADLRKWVNWATVTVAGATQVWAPEWYVEAGTVRLLLSVSTDSMGTFNLRSVTATAGDLSTFGAATSITGTAFPTQMIDPFIVKDGSTYHLFYKNDVTDYIEHATSSSLLSGYTVVQSGNHSGWGTLHEGPCIVAKPGGGWRIYVDNPGLSYADSTNLSDWSTLTPINQFPAAPAMRHGTVIRA